MATVNIFQTTSRSFFCARQKRITVVFKTRVLYLQMQRQESRRILLLAKRPHSHKPNKNIE